MCAVRQVGPFFVQAAFRVSNSLPVRSIPSERGPGPVDRGPRFLDSNRDTQPRHQDPRPATSGLRQLHPEGARGGALGRSPGDPEPAAHPGPVRAWGHGHIPAKAGRRTERSCSEPPTPYASCWVRRYHPPRFRLTSGGWERSGKPSMRMRSKGHGAKVSRWTRTKRSPSPSPSDRQEILRAAITPSRVGTIVDLNLGSDAIARLVASIARVLSSYSLGSCVTRPLHNMLSQM